MANGKITDAEVELELTGDRRAIDRLLLTGQKELQRGLVDLKGSVDEMRAACEERGRTCPGLHPDLADPVTELPEDRRTWVMWGAGTAVLERIALPLVLVALTILLTRVF